MYKNNYPRDLIDKCINKFLDRVLTAKIVVSTLLKKDLMIVLPYLGKLSLQIRTRINCVMKSKLPYCNSRRAFQTKCRLLFKYGSCNATYYGKTNRHFKVRMCEHLGVSALTGKRMKRCHKRTFILQLFMWF